MVELRGGIAGVVPVTGYFEFHHSGKEVTPHYIFLKDEEVFGLRGLCDEWEHPDTGEIVQTFTVLTVPANELCRGIHNGGKNPFRMPLIIGKENENRWLDPFYLRCLGERSPKTTTTKVSNY